MLSNYNYLILVRTPEYVNPDKMMDVEMAPFHSKRVAVLLCSSTPLVLCCVQDSSKSLGGTALLVGTYACSCCTAVPAGYIVRIPGALRI